MLRITYSIANFAALGGAHFHEWLFETCIRRNAGDGFIYTHGNTMDAELTAIDQMRSRDFPATNFLFRSRMIISACTLEFSINHLLVFKPPQTTPAR